jgi:hypothetical protein
MDDKNKIIGLVILVLILVAAVVYFVFFDKKECKVCQDCPDCPTCKVCPVCPVCPALPTKYSPETSPQTFPIGGDRRSFIPDGCSTSYSQLVLQAQTPPSKKGKYLAAEGNCEYGDTGPVKNYCENNGGLVAQFVTGTQDQDGMCAKTFGIGKSGQIYNMQ